MTEAWGCGGEGASRSNEEARLWRREAENEPGGRCLESCSRSWREEEKEEEEDGEEEAAAPASRNANE